MKGNFKENLVKQRESMKMSKAEVEERINSSPFGEKTKEWAKRWAEVESYGSVGFGLYNVIPIMSEGKGAYLYDADGKWD